MRKEKYIKYKEIFEANFCWKDTVDSVKKKDKFYLVLFVFTPAVMVLGCDIIAV